MSNEAPEADSILKTEKLDDGNFPEPKNHGPFPKFSDLLHDIVIPISEVKKDPLEPRTLTSRKYEIVERFIRNYRWTVGDNIYPVGRLLLPDRDNRLYHAKESKLGDLIIKIYKIPAGSKDYDKIKKWKRSAENSFGRGEHGFAEICCEAIKFRGAVNVEGNVVTVAEVNQFLDDFGKNSPDPVLEADDEEVQTSRSSYQKDLLQGIVSRMNLDEIRYLIKIMMRLKLLKGMENSFISSWHPEAPRLFDLINDLRRVFYQLHNQKVRLQSNEALVRVGYPFKPQLASRTNLNYEQLATSLDNDFFLEEKLDGERMQLHMDNFGEVFAYFSRRATNYTSLYGADYNSGSFSQYIKGCFPKNVKSIILDGEMLVFDHKRKQMLPFGFLKGSALSTISDSNESARPMFIAYDILYLNGTSLEKASLLKRRQALLKALSPIENVIEVVKYYKVSDAKDIERALRKAIEINSEGVILKNPRSIYSVAERNKQWIKVKPEYLDEFGEDVDVVIIGKTIQNKTSYMCGLRDSVSEGEDTASPHFISFCSIANGISIDDYNALEQRLHGKWKDIKKKPPPAELLEFGSRLPEVWVDPTQSVVIQVKARSVDIGQGGLSYKAGTTLYNAYFKDIRDDKDWTDSLSLEEYREIKTATSRKQKLDNQEKTAVSKRKKARLTKKQLLANELAKSQDVDATSSVFASEDLVFYVLSDMVSDKFRKTIGDIVAAIKANGGTAIFDIRHCSKKIMVFSDKASLKAQALHNQGYDIIKPQYVFDCILLQRMIPIEPSHCLLVSDKLFNESLTKVDRYGDSYLIPIEKELNEYASNLEIADSSLLKNTTESEMLQNEIFFLFKDCKFYIEQCKLVDDTEWSIMRLKSLIRLYGGEIITHGIEAASYVIIPDYDDLLHGTIDEGTKAEIVRWKQEKGQDLRQYYSRNVELGEDGRLGKLPRIISDRWIEEYAAKFS